MSGDLTEELRNTNIWTEQLLLDAGIPFTDYPLVSVGGGFGSFSLIDRLRICGVPPEQLRVVTPMANPWETYQRLALNSQIPDHERIRSDSASCPDNLWGFPSYALTEAWRDRSLKPILQVGTEPIFADYYTPRAEPASRCRSRRASPWTLTMSSGVNRSTVSRSTASGPGHSWLARTRRSAGLIARSGSGTGMSWPRT